MSSINALRVSMWMDGRLSIHYDVRHRSCLPQNEVLVQLYEIEIIGIYKVESY